jgi:antitoxin FitA
MKEPIMASVTIRNIDEEVKRKLRLRAAGNGRSMEAELREAVYALVENDDAEMRSEVEARAIHQRLRTLTLPPLEPFDQKAASDELYAYLDEDGH